MDSALGISRDQAEHLVDEQSWRNMGWFKVTIRARRPLESLGSSTRSLIYETRNSYSHGVLHQASYHLGRNRELQARSYLFLHHQVHMFSSYHHRATQIRRPSNAIPARFKRAVQQHKITCITHGTHAHHTKNLLIRSPARMTTIWYQFSFESQPWIKRKCFH